MKGDREKGEDAGMKGEMPFFVNFSLLKQGNLTQGREAAKKINSLRLCSLWSIEEVLKTLRKL